MTFNFAESWDLYANQNDAADGYWDSANVAGTFVAGRFPGSRAVSMSTSQIFIKTSGVNDAVHHLVLSFEQTSAITGATMGLYFSLYDGTSPQCSVVFRTDGAIVLTTGGPTGAVIAAYPGAFTQASVWYAFEIEIVIGATGAFRVRKNGNNITDFDSGAVNTQTSANAYANRLQVGASSTSIHVWDDFFWRSGATAGSWMGDIRCYSRMPQSDVSIQFTPSQNVGPQQVNVTSLNLSQPANVSRALQFVALYTGTIATGTFYNSTAQTGNIKFAMYDSTRTILLGTATVITDPSTVGYMTFTFPTPIAVLKGITYHLAYNLDQALTLNVSSIGVNGWSITAPYSGFPPATMAGWVSGNLNFPATQLNYTNIANSSLVGEPQQDGIATYVYDSTPGHQDLYAIAAIPSTPLTTFMVVTRGYMEKTDAGTRTACVQIKSGSTTVASPTLTLSTSGFQWTYRQDLVDPATGTAWTATAVNNAQIGPKTVA